MTVRYVPPDEQNVEERSLDLGEVLSIGRSPVGDGITLLETNQDISRSAIELELEADGVRVTNTSRYSFVKVGPKGRHLMSKHEAREACEARTREERETKA